MTDERLLRDLLTRTAVPFDPLDGVALRAAADHRKRHTGLRRAIVPAAAAVSVATIAVAAAVLAHHPFPAGPGGTSAPAPTSSRPTAGRGGTADQPFRVRLVLPGTSFPADGQPIHAYVVATNHTGGPVLIHNACDGWVQAGLTGGHASFTMISSGVRCASKTIAPGTTRIRVSIPTTFTQCQQGKRAGTPDLPHCVGPHDDRFPGLPAGSYQAVVGTQSTSVRPVLSQPQPVTLTAVR